MSIPSSAAIQDGSLDFERLVETLSRKDLVLFGEDHSERDILQNQLALLAAINTRLGGEGRQLALALEHFNTDKKSYFSREPGKVSIYNKDTRFQALEHLAGIYRPDIASPELLSEDYVSEEFKKYVAPLIDFSLNHGNVTIEPIGKPSMKGHKSCPDLVSWNISMKDALKTVLPEYDFVFAVIGADHLLKPSYDEVTIPHLLAKESKDTSVGAIIQTESKKERQFIVPLFNLPCESYQIHGRLISDSGF